MATSIGPYALGDELGSGGMGRVWRATAPDGAPVALKVVHPHVAARADFLARFRREADVGLRVRHPNVVATLAAGTDGGAHWIALEYVEGQTLRGLLGELGVVPEDLCRHVAVEVARGLAAVHAAGAVHRDVKPENVLITRDHVVKLMDLGIARMQGDDGLTETGAFVGSLAYAAPEQFRNAKGIDARADLHALGVVLLELATGTNPFAAGEFPETLRRILDLVPRRIGEANPQVGPFLEEVVAWLLAKDPADRPASAGVLLDVLEAGEGSAWWRARAKAIRAATARPLRRVRIPRETAIVGRDADLAALRAAWDAARTGDGRVVLVEGEPGVGKSRLVDEFAASLAAAGEDVDFLHGAHAPGAWAATGALAEAFREHLGDDTAAIAGALAEMPAAAPAFAAFLRGAAPDAGVLPLDREALATAFVRAMQGLARVRPVLLLVEDVHFAGADGRELFLALSRAVAGHRVLLVATTRPGPDPAFLAALQRPGAQHLVVGRLGPEDLVALLAASLGSGHAARELAGRIAETSDGNPYFVFEILRSLRERGLLRQSDSGWSAVTSIREAPLPASIRALIDARLSALAAEDREILEAAACIGFEFDPLLLAEAAGLPRLALLKRLAQIERSHRLVRSAGRVYAFDHHQVQETLHAELPELLREQYHAAIAERLEARAGGAEPEGAACVDLVRHQLAGGLGAQALPRLGAALTYLEQRSQPAAAAALMGAALAQPALLAGAERCRLLLRRVRAFQSFGSLADEAAAGDEAWALAEASGDAALRAAAGLDRALRLARAGTQESAEPLRRVRDEARARGDDRIVLSATEGLLRSLVQSGRMDEALAEARPQLDLARRLDVPAREISALEWMARVALDRAGPAAAVRAYEEAYEVARTRAPGRPRRQAAVHRASAHLLCGRLEDAREAFETVREEMRELGERRNEAAAVGNLAVVCAYQGEPDSSEELTVAAGAIARESGLTSSEWVAEANLALVDADRGRLDAACRRLDACLARVRAAGAAAAFSFAYWYLADAQIRAGRADAAGAVLDEWLAVVRAARDGRSELLALATATRLPSSSPAEAAARAKSAEAALAVHGGLLRWREEMDVRLRLHQATGRADHLAAARAALDFGLAHTAPHRRDAMSRNVPLHREILAASGG